MSSSLHLSLASLVDGDAPAGDDGMVVVEPVDPVDVAALKKALTPAKTMMSFFQKVSPGSAPAPASSAGSKRPAIQVATPSTGSAKKVTVVSHHSLASSHASFAPSSYGPTPALHLRSRSLRSQRPRMPMLHQPVEALEPQAEQRPKIYSRWLSSPNQRSMQEERLR
jgi:hypothetical protein